MKNWKIGLVLTIMALLITACPDSGGKTPVKGDFSLAGNPVAITIGQSGTTAVTITRTSNFADLVNLSLIGYPTGVTPSFNPSSANTTSTLMLTVDNTVPAGTYNLTITGSAAGKTRNSPAFTLTIKPKQDNGSFDLKASNVNVTKDSVVINNIVTLANGNSNITINRKNGFSGAVKLTTENLPAGVTPTFTPNDTAGNSSILKLEIASNAPTGTHTITVKGTSGTKIAETSFVLTIDPKPNNGSFTISASPVTITKNSVVQPQALATANSTITIARSNFTGAIHLETQGLPTGVKANPVFTPNDTTGNSSTLKLELEANAPTGTHTITVKGTSGTKTAETTFVLTIDLKPNNGSFTISASPVTITKNSVVQPQALATANSTITIARSNFTGAIHLETQGLPTGVKANPVFTPNDTTGNSSTLKLELEANAPTGTHTITVKGTSGTKTATTTFSLTIEIAGDTTKPRIVSIFPKDGDRGITESVNIIVEFSEVMDKQTAEDAFTSISMGSVRFLWINGDKTMIIIPVNKLEYSPNEGFYYYSYDIASTAKDLAGNSLENPSTAKFTTYRTITKKLISEKSLDGFLYEGSPLSFTNRDYIIIGDNAYNKYYRGYLSFDLSSLPNDTLKVIDAQVYAYRYKVDGYPYRDLRDFIYPGVIITPLYYGMSLEKDDLTSDCMCISFPFSHTEYYGWYRQLVTSWTQIDFENRANQNNKTQYRLQFAYETDNDNSKDLVYFHSGDFGTTTAQKALRPYLKIKYLVP